MSDDRDRLYELLPAVHRRRDQETGGTLRDLLRVVAEQAQVIEADIAQLYENWFVETADDWVVPYIGALIGYAPVAEAGLAGRPTSVRSLTRDAVLVPRREVANTLRHRRRKGTLALLEELAADVTGWPGRAVEFSRLLGWSQALNHQRPSRGRVVDLRRVNALDRLGGAFDELAHTVDVRRVSSHRTTGRHNLPEVGLFLWRLRPYPVHRAPAYLAEEAGGRCFTFSILGNDAPLFTAPAAEGDTFHLAEETNVPAPIRRLGLEDHAGAGRRSGSARASAAYYGHRASFAVWAPGWPVRGAPQPVPREHIVPADLSGWRYRPRPGEVAVDPVLGRMMFPPRQPPPGRVHVRYHYGFSGDIGGGQYERLIPAPSLKARSRFTDADLPDPASLLTALKDGTSPLSRYLVDRWSGPHRALLDRWSADGGGPGPELTAALVTELNLVLSDAGLYDAERFPGTPAPLESAALEHPSGDRLGLVNRQLLEFALPAGVAVAAWHRRVATVHELRSALADWRAAGPRRAVIELDTNEVFSLPVEVRVGPRQELTIRAGQRRRPVLRLLDRDADRPDSLDVFLAPGARFVLDGILVTGRAVRFQGVSGEPPEEPEGGYDEEDAGDRGDGSYASVEELPPRAPAPLPPDPECPGTRRVAIRHCTLVPGWTIHHDCESGAPGEPSIELVDLGGGCVVVDHSIVGPVEVTADVDATDPVCIEVHDSIVDAVEEARLAVRAPGGAIAYADLTVARTTVFGAMAVHRVTLAENSIFTGPVIVARRQHGCVRFCSVPAGSRTPRRFACQPDVAEQALLDAGGGPVAAEVTERERDRVRPRFTSARYGRPDYAQLALACAAEIAAGADDESEMGAFHDLYQPQRTASLAVRLDEHSPAGLDAGVIFVT